MVAGRMEVAGLGGKWMSKGMKGECVDVYGVCEWMRES